MRPELIVAEKEFRDHVTSKRFVIVFGIMVLIAIYGINAGMDNYYQRLDNYKAEQPDPFNNNGYIIQNLQDAIQSATETGKPAEYIAGLQSQLDLLTNPPMPTVREVFQGMIFILSIMGMVLGAAMGFDQISREKDEGSIKFLVSSPIYRDAIINGKTIGAILTLAVAMAAAFVTALAIVMIKGAVPGVEDLVRILLFFVASLLYCTVFFAIAMMLSAIAKNTATAAIFTVGLLVLLALYSLLSFGIAYSIAGMMMGPVPEEGTYEYAMRAEMENGTYAQPDYTEFAAYQTKRQTVVQQVSDVITAFSPINGFGGTLGTGNSGIGVTLLANPSTTQYISGPNFFTSVNIPQEMSLTEALGSIWTKALAIIVEIVAAFGIAYVAFMRADVR